ncbi:hypothetical protein V1478_009840, partial [Vespula squamosa]
MEKSGGEQEEGRINRKVTSVLDSGGTNVEIKVGWLRMSVLPGLNRKWLRTFRSGRRYTKLRSPTSEPSRTGSFSDDASSSKREEEEEEEEEEGEIIRSIDSYFYRRVYNESFMTIVLCLFMKRKRRKNKKKKKNNEGGREWEKME